MERSEVSSMLKCARGTGTSKLNVAAIARRDVLNAVDRARLPCRCHQKIFPAQIHDDCARGYRHVESEYGFQIALNVRDWEP